MLHTEEENNHYKLNYYKLYLIFKVIAIYVNGADVCIVTFEYKYL